MPFKKKYTACIILLEIWMKSGLNFLRHWGRILKHFLLQYWNLFFFVIFKRMLSFFWQCQFWPLLLAWNPTLKKIFLQAILSNKLNPVLRARYFPHTLWREKDKKKTYFQLVLPRRQTSADEWVVPNRLSRSMPSRTSFWSGCISFWSLKMFERERSATTTLDEQELSIFFCGGTHTHTHDELTLCRAGL